MRVGERNIKELVMMSIFEVFEKMYYVFLEAGECASSDKQRRVVQIQFSGALHGEMQIYYSEGLAETMIENALGMDKDEITDQIIEDCLKECINMICGNFLQKFEPDKVLQLSIPRYLGKAPVPADMDGTKATHIAFESDGMAMDAILTFTQIND